MRGLPKLRRLLSITRSAPPDLGLKKDLNTGLLAEVPPPAPGYAQLRRRHHATNARNSTGVENSLQLPTLRARRQGGEPPGNTHTLPGHGGPPKILQRGGEHDPGG